MFSSFKARRAALGKSVKETKLCFRRVSFQDHLLRPPTTGMLAEAADRHGSAERQVSTGGDLV